MKQHYFILLLLFLSLVSVDAQELADSRIGSYYTYIYQITDDEAEQIYNSDVLHVDQAILHTLIDSFPCGEKYEKQLPLGHYLKTYTQENQQKFSITTVNHCEAFVLNNSTDLQVQVYDLQGKLIENAEVSVDNKSLRFDEETKCYLHRKSNRKGLLKVSYQGKACFANLDRSYSNSAFRRNSRKILYFSPLKYVWKPIRFVVFLPVDGVKSIVHSYPQGTIYQTKNFFVNLYHRIFDPYDYNYDFTSKHTGYLVFSQPKYRQGDTVRFKAFLVNKKGKPIDKAIYPKIYGYKKTIKLPELKPYRKGAYESFFVLHDSLGLKLDRNYSLNLNTKEEDTYLRKSFKYEDYELKGIKLSVRTNIDEQYKGREVKLFMRGSDENDLNLQGARVKIVVKSGRSKQFFAQQVFVPDTIYTHEMSLKAAGETNLVLADSLFPKANLNYKVKVDLYTADNQHKSATSTVNFYHDRKEIDYELLNDSIQIRYLENGIAKEKQLEVVAVDNFENKTPIYKGNSRITIPLSPYYASYQLRVGKIKKEIKIAQQNSGLYCASNRNRDSIQLEIENPRNLPFTYCIYRGNHLVKKAYATHLNFRKKNHSSDNYYVNVNYMWGGEMKTSTYHIPLVERKLNVQVDQPDLIYPGQETEIEVEIKDMQNRPVEGVDITAMGLTQKFHYNAPNLPSFEKKRKQKEMINQFQVSSNLKRTGQKLLDYQTWKALAQLDTIAYYQFLYPENLIYTSKSERKDSVTQFAPFVMREGANVNIDVIYVDHKPVYFSWSDNNDQYSFPVSPGKHHITLRTRTREFHLKNIFFSEGKKTILSIDEEIRNERVKVQPMPSELTEREKQVLYRYIFPFRNKFGARYAYLQQDSLVHFLNPNPRTHTRSQLAGPVSGLVDFHLMEMYDLQFIHETGFEYDFSNELLKMREVDTEVRYPVELRSYTNKVSLRDSVLLLSDLKERWQKQLDKRRMKVVRYDNSYRTHKGNGKLQIEFAKHVQKEYQRPLNLLLFCAHRPDFIRIYRGWSREFQDLKEGNYQLILFYPGQQYCKIDSIDVKKNGRNFYRINSDLPLKKDHFSIEVSKLIEKHIYSGQRSKGQKKAELNYVNKKYQEEFAYKGKGYWIEGRVLAEEDGLSIPGVSVVVKGTAFGVSTDIDGYYRLKVPVGYSDIQFSFVGMKEKVVNANLDDVSEVRLESDTIGVDEVIVVAYGMSNVSRSLAGSVAGVQIKSKQTQKLILQSDQTASIRIRGTNSIGSSQKPLLVVDGKIFTGSMSDLNPELIVSTKVLKESQATTLYGSRAANGVILIQTKGGGLAYTATEKGADFDQDFLVASMQQGSLRSNFSDQAFWQPRLQTDKNGKAKFKVKFPDDVTSWQTIYLAMNDKKQTGQTQATIKSYKPLMAKTSLPRFLTVSDTCYALGKVVNYTRDTMQVKSQLFLNGEKQFEKEQACVDLCLDSLKLIGQKKELKVKYIMEKEDGYFDGEEKNIPVFPVGLEEKKALFYALEGDTTVHVKFDSTLGKVKFHAESKVLNVLDQEIRHVLAYRYNCNEQIASKLKALLAQKQICTFQNKEFKEDQKVKRFIRLLKKNRHSSGLWGWWKSSQESNWWISIHILEALAEAEKMGYEVQIARTDMSRQMVWDLQNKKNSYHDLRILKVANLLNLELDYKKYLKELEQDSLLNFTQRLQIAQLKQAREISQDLSFLKKYRHETLFGSAYYCDSVARNYWYDNSVQSSILAYQILKKEGKKHASEIRKIRNYFFENKRTSYWRNTYESAQIIACILPDLLKDGKKITKPEIKISGSHNQQVNKFPFDMELNAEDEITIEKTGTYPVYISCSQSYWNSNPVSKQSDYVIKTSFEEQSDDLLKAGEQVNLLVKVNILKDSEFLMLNIPIPAGCSYEKKSAYHPHEAHRQYFKNEVAIFCEKLKEGSYEFRIPLRSRFTGNYQLNPARIEQMYFPIFNANTKMKRVQIKDAH